MYPTLKVPDCVLKHKVYCSVDLSHHLRGLSSLTWCLPSLMCALFSQLDYTYTAVHVEQCIINLTNCGKCHSTLLPQCKVSLHCSVLCIRAMISLAGGPYLPPDHGPIAWIAWNCLNERMRWLLLSKPCLLRFRLRIRKNHFQTVKFLIVRNWTADISLSARLIMELIFHDQLQFIFQYCRYFQIWRWAASRFPVSYHFLQCPTMKSKKSGWGIRK